MSPATGPGEVRACVSEPSVSSPIRSPYPVRLGHAVRGRREALGLSRAQLSLRAGIAVGTLRSIERGDARRRPRRVLEWLAQTLHTTTDGLRELAEAQG